MTGPILLVLVLCSAVCVGAVALLRKGVVVPAESARLTHVARIAVRWNWIGIISGLIAAIISMQMGLLGRGVLMAAPLFSLCVLMAVVIGE
jgi:hypothetical protein